MEALTDQNILDTIRVQIRTGVPVDPTTIAYIRELLTPYAQAVDQATSVASVHAWVDQVYPPSLRWVHDRLNETNTVHDAAFQAIAFLVRQLAEAAAHYPADVLMPWDIKQGIQLVGQSSDSIAALTPVTAGNTLPVTVRLNGQDHVHQLSQDFVVGLTDYYRYTNAVIQLFMFGVPLTVDDRVRYRYMGKRTASCYIAVLVIQATGNEDEIDDHDPEIQGEDVEVYRCASTSDYIRGMHTGQLWENNSIMTHQEYVDADSNPHRIDL
jgi:hypothetical protein